MNEFIKENKWFLAISLTFILIVFLESLLMPYGNEICSLNQARFEPLNTLFIFWTKLGEEKIWLLAIALLALFKNYRASLIMLFIGGLVILSAFYSKTILQTSRPAKFFKEQKRLQEVVFVPNVEIYQGNTSFPSGHTMSAFAFWGIVAFISRRRVWVDVLCAFMACGVGFSRIFLCQHFLVDVGAGASLGLLIFLICWQISRNTNLFTAPYLFKSLLGDYIRFPQ